MNTTSEIDIISVTDKLLASLGRLLAKADGDTSFSDGYRFGLEQAIAVVTFQADLEAIFNSSSES
jgi:hypothetical protein